MSGAPSLVNSLNSYSSNTKLNVGSQSIKSPESEQPFLDHLLEKAKFYTSLCLGIKPSFKFYISFFVSVSHLKFQKEFTNLNNFLM